MHRLRRYRKRTGREYTNVHPRPVLLPDRVSIMRKALFQNRLPFQWARRRSVHRAAFPAGAASAAGSAACTIPAAGALSRSPVADHAADQQRDDQHDDGDEYDIDEIDGYPGQHRDTSLQRVARCEAESVQLTARRQEREERIYFTVSFCASL